MDLSCSFLQSNGLNFGSSSHMLNSRHVPRGSRRGCIGNSKVFYGAFLTKRRQKVTTGTGYFNPRFQYGEGMKQFLHITYSRNSETARDARLWCQTDDSLSFLDGQKQDAEFPGNNLSGGRTQQTESSCKEPVSLPGSDKETNFLSTVNSSEEEESNNPQLEELNDMLQKAIIELEVARRNSAMFEEKAQKISELAIQQKDAAENAWKNMTSTLSTIQEIIDEETNLKDAVQKATMSLSMAEARVEVATAALQSTKETTGSAEDLAENKEQVALLSAQEEFTSCKDSLSSIEAELREIQNKKSEMQSAVDRLSKQAEKAQFDAMKTEEEVSNVMSLAEQAVAFELEAAKHVNDAEIALKRAEKSLSAVDTTEMQGVLPQEQIVELVEEGTMEDVPEDEIVGVSVETDVQEFAHNELSFNNVIGQNTEMLSVTEELNDQQNTKMILTSNKEAEVAADKTKITLQAKKQETQKDLPKESSPPLSASKAPLNKSSRFFSASFFSFDVDGEEFTPTSIFREFLVTAKKQAPKLVFGILLLGAGAFFLNKRAYKNSQILPQTEIVTSIEDVTSTAMPIVKEIQKIPRRLKKIMELIPHQEVNEEEASLLDMLWLLLASVIFVPVFQKIPGGSPVLGYLAAGILIGPYGLSIIRNVHGTKAIAEFGVVFLLFNIGLELSVERLSSMKKYVFGLGSAQVLVTATVVGLAAHYVAQLAGPAALVIGNGLALSSTAVVLQVLQERGESTSRHGRATFSVLLFQDLAVVVLLILIPLISPNSSKGGASSVYARFPVAVNVSVRLALTTSRFYLLGRYMPGHEWLDVTVVASALDAALIHWIDVGFQAIAEALGMAAVKALVAITAIIAGGRLLLRPIYRQIAENQNAEIFSANTLLVILGTSLLTARAGLSMALGAFLAGLLLAETEFSLQVESDIAPYRGLLLGLFFMTVGMSIDPKLLFSNFPIIMSTLGLLIIGKITLVVLVGKTFGISTIAAIRVGLLLAPGGEFAFVAFGEAVNQGIMSSQLSSLLFLVVGISMALTPWLAAGGQLLASRFEQHDVRSLLPMESETDDLQDHIIICGFGRVGQIIAQLLSERLIPFVALDVRSDRVAIGRALDLPVYFGDAGSREVLHKIGAERACAAAITLDSPGANYRTVWALSKYFPNVKTFVRAHDVDHGLNLEKAGATAVVPETLEPSLQLAAAVLAQAKLPTSEIAATINEFRSRHLSELTELCQASGSSLGYGFSRVMSKPRPQISDSDDNQIAEGSLAI